jgi:hypothetical protein
MCYYYPFSVPIQRRGNFLLDKNIKTPIILWNAFLLIQKRQRHLQFVIIPGNSFGEGP